MLAVQLSRLRLCRRLQRSAGWLAVLAASSLHWPVAAQTTVSPDVLLVTLDTTRADELGSYGGPATPHLDALAAAGTRYERAITSSPLTLPAHASLLTGLTPPEHGIHDNGIASLGSTTPTVATVFGANGYATAAVVGSRVLDRRFGLARGFDHYDDLMAAEHRGEYGYPERTGRAVTDAALDWLRGRGKDRTPLFLWVHYYDPHAPYSAPGVHGASDLERYRNEIQYVDQQIGRLLAGLPKRPRVVAVVADHGESLGAHGERGHGLLLHEPTLRVPLILQGPGVPAAKTVGGVVASRRLAPTLLELAGLKGEGETDLGQVLPGLENPPSEKRPSATRASEPGAVFSETHLPFTAYGWSVVEALTQERLRFVVGARGELFDLESDPTEDHNLVDKRRQAARHLQQELARRHSDFSARPSQAAPDDPEILAALRSLGYLSGSSGRGIGRPDPQRLDAKKGLILLEEFEQAKQLAGQGLLGASLASLEELARRNPENVPLLSHLAGTRIAVAMETGGDPQAGIDAYRKALALNPRLEFLHLGLAKAMVRLGRTDEAAEAYRGTLALDPRNADAWLGLAEAEARRGRATEERRLLEDADQAGTESAAILTRLAQLALQKGGPEETLRAGEHLRRATDLTPEWVTPWLLLGRWELDHGSAGAGRAALQRVLQLAPESPQARQARRWLGG